VYARRVDRLALGRALTLALRLLVDDMHDRLDAQGFTDLRPAYGYVLNAAVSDDLTASDVAALLGITKQGAAKLLAEMTDAGYVTRRRSEHDARARPVELTARGREALAAAEAAQRAIEAEWASLASARDVAAMRRVLDAVVASRGDQPPRLRPAW
jgi:DNA-binding MarR family transcriptional regulator